MTGGPAADSSPAKVAAERFLRALEARGSSPNTVRSYRTGLGAYLGWVSANGHDWRTPSRADLRAYLAVLAEGHVKRTVAQRLAAVRSFYRFTTRQGLHGCRFELRSLGIQPGRQKEPSESPHCFNLRSFQHPVRRQPYGVYAAILAQQNIRLQHR